MSQYKTIFINSEVFMFINFTNHPSANWSAEQLAAAERYGEIVDLSFPDVQAKADESMIAKLADEKCSEICGHDPDAVLVQGEMTLTFAVVKRLLDKGITVLCAASERICETNVSEDGSTIRKSVFKFAGFRRYGL